MNSVPNGLPTTTRGSPNIARKDSELGSGVVYKKVGDSIFIITNAHVVGDKEEQKITYGENKAVKGKVLGTDK